MQINGIPIPLTQPTKKTLPISQLKNHSGYSESDMNKNLNDFDSFNKTSTELDELNQQSILNSTSSIQKIQDTSGQIELYVNSLDPDLSFEDWAKNGSSPYLDATDAPNNVVYGEYEGPGSKDGDRVGNFSFENTAQSGIIDSAKLRIFGHANSSNPNQVYFSVHLWDMSSWSHVVDIKESDYVWKEVDVSSHINTWSKINGAQIYLETVAIGGRRDGGQACDAVSLQINWTTDETPPVINNFGVDDLGNGTGSFWADVTDLKSDVANVTLKMNNTKVNMTYNSTYWIYSVPVVYNGFYNYSISNASDIYGNCITNPSENQNHTFDKDIIAPRLIDAYYSHEINPPNGTFNASVFDAWGEIDTIFVNVTHISGDPLTENLTAIMKNTTSGYYINDTIEIQISGVIKFVIFGNDTAGNRFVSDEISGYYGVNTPPSVSDITFSPYPIHSNETLTLSYSFYDFNDDSEGGTEIRWYKNKVLMNSYNDSLIIQSFDLIKGDQWYVTIKPKDGHLFGDLVNSSEESGGIITIQNSAPKITSISYTPGNPAIPGVLIEDEDINITYFFDDVDPIDEDESKIKWFIDGVYNNQYDGLKKITENVTKNGETWRVEINPYDGFEYGRAINLSIFIESRPVINDYDFDYLEDKEGHLSFRINATNALNPITEVLYLFYLNGSDLPQKSLAELEGGTDDLWILEYELNNYSYLNFILSVEITATSLDSLFQLYEISSMISFNLTIEDRAPPRVIDVNLEKDNEIKPTNLSIYVTVEEFGSGVAEIVLYYYFMPANDANEVGGTGSNEPQLLNSSMTLLNVNGSSSFWFVTIDFPEFNYDVDFVYQIYTKDNIGNENPVAFIKDQRFIYHPPGLPEWLVLLTSLLVIVTFIGSIIYIKFIRKPEIIGFEKSQVLNEIKEINENDVMASLESHTLGIILSFFDQAHGPVPIIIEPELLKDNYSKLVELSDRSFSGTGFSDDFDTEILSNYDFTLMRGLKINVMTFGFSLENPESRGGKENLTLNILVNRNIFPLLRHFEEEIQEKVHDAHVLMQKDPSKKEEIHTSVVEVRKYISYIVLAYDNLYQTTELLTEDEI